MFSAGDTVRIRQWEDMVEEFGFEGGHKGDDINCKGVFVKAMRPLCGMEFTIEEVNTENKIVTLVEEPPELYGRHGHKDMKFLITTDMIEHFDALKTEKIIDDSALLDMVL